jgi:hypothetical protein
MSISAYPLHWPPGWKRTPASNRVRAKFGKASRHEGYGENQRWVPGRDLTIFEGTQRVLLELSRMGMSRERAQDDVVISTNLRLRLDGLPVSSQAEPADPGVAVYWQEPLGGRKVMAIDIYDRVADNLAAVAATLDAMRAIERHGGAAILERAFTGFTALPAPITAGMKRHWREVLQFNEGGLNTPARVTGADVQQRYRQLATNVHPDRATDDADREKRNRDMAELNVARDEALGEVRRG